MTKVAILGNAGGGKSTLSKALSEAKDLPLYQLDKIAWNPGWVATPKQTFDREHDSIVEKDAWIIDGMSSLESIKRRMERADTIILIDNPLWIHYCWAAKRQFMCLFQDRPDFVEGCPMLPKTWELAEMIWRIDKHLRPTLIELMENQRDNKQVYHIQSPDELACFREEHCSN
jgi:adenylate kinase family enzyme